MSDFPFEEKQIAENVFLRYFDHNVLSEELIWHRDKRSRTVHVLSGNGWKLQLDDELPTNLEIGKQYFIIKNSYHRLIKGENNLVIRIEE